MKVKRQLAGRYALAFVDNIEEKDFTALLEDIKTIRTLIKDNPELMKYMQSIITPKKMRLQLLEKIINEQDTYSLNLHNKLRGLLTVLILNHRMPIINEILDASEKLLLTRQNKAKIKILFARQHASELINKIIEYAGKLAEKDLIAESEIRPEIIGGFIATVESIRIDGSVRHNLDKFKQISKT